MKHSLDRGLVKFLSYGDFPESFHLHWFRVMEKALSDLGWQGSINPKNHFRARLSQFFTKLRLNRPLLRTGRYCYFVPIMQPMEHRFFPVSYCNEIIPLCFDCWPNNWARWESMFRRHRVRLAFFTAKDSANEFARRLPKMECLWLPEATDPAFLQPSNLLRDRKTDVLEMGRKYDMWHEAVAGGLSARGKVHLYEKVRGEVIFDKFTLTSQGLGDSKISVCFPGSLTHPQRSGHVETVTMRYYETMGSRCIILGKCPAELVDDFGYNPLIEADLTQPLEQVLHILENIECYQESVDRNWKKVQSSGTWRFRFEHVQRELLSRGYRIAP